MKPVIFSIKDIVLMLRGRQDNEFDANLAVCGDRGDGKSTLLNKLFYRLPEFDPWKHQVYSQQDVIKLLTTQTKGICFDDEAINSGYKRSFQDKGQQKLIKILTNYRDNYNVHASALPNFFSLDKDLRDLMFILLHVIKRGVAVVHLPLSGRMYSQDRWDAKHNAKIEQSWSVKAKINPNFIPPYHRLSTFAGYLYFGNITEKQRELYKEIKRTKRAQEFSQEENGTTNTNKKLYERILPLLIEGKLDQQGIIQMCLIEGEKFTNVSANLNRALKDGGYEGTLKDYLKSANNKNRNNLEGEIKDLVPSF